MMPTRNSLIEKFLHSLICSVRRNAQKILRQKKIRQRMADIEQDERICIRLCGRENTKTRSALHKAETCNVTVTHLFSARPAAAMPYRFSFGGLAFCTGIWFVTPGRHPHPAGLIKPAPLSVTIFYHKITDLSTPFLRKLYFCAGHMYLLSEQFMLFRQDSQSA